MPHDQEGEEDILAQLKTWNPMTTHYTSSNTNKYTSGIGEKKGTQRPYLVFKCIPDEMTIDGLKNICMNYGKVKEVRISKKNDYWFVDLETVNDMERVFTALERNKFGFKVVIGKQKPNSSDQSIEQPQARPQARQFSKPSPSPFNKNFTNKIDHDNRSYKYGTKYPPRPHFHKEPIVKNSDYESRNNLLLKNDPKKHFLVNGDAHDLERNNFRKTTGGGGGGSFQGESSWQRYRAVCHPRIPEKTKNLILEKHKKTGQNFGNEKTYINTNKKSDPKNIGKCDECQCLCDSVCGRCSTYFCGLECQKNAWPQHRYACGPKRIPLPPPESAFKIDMKKIESRKERLPRNGGIVTLTCVQKSNVVFVRSRSFDDNLEFFKIISEVQKFASDAEPLTKAPFCGQIVIAQFGEQFNRAMVLNTKNLEKINLIYIDYGNLDIKSMDELLIAPDEFVNLPRFAVPVILKDVPDIYLTQEIRKFMLSYLDMIDLQIKYNADDDFVSDKGVYKVELINKATGHSYNEQIINLAAAIYPSNDDEVLYREFLKLIPLPSGANIKLVVMDNSLMRTGCISCSTDYYAHEIQKFHPQLQKYCENEDREAYAPRVDELCIAKYNVDQKWYRGRCIDLVGDGFPTIVFFDYGNIAPVSIKDIRRYPVQFSFPVFTADCEVEGLPEEVDEETVKRLEELIPNGSVIECDFIEAFEEEHFYKITLKDVRRKLQLEGLIK